jgi:hypothetical protein
MDTLRGAKNYGIVSHNDICFQFQYLQNSPPAESRGDGKDDS